LVVVADGDADGGEVEAVLAVILLGQFVDQRLGLGGIGVAQQEQGLAADGGGGVGQEGLLGFVLQVGGRNAVNVLQDAQRQTAKALVLPLFQVCDREHVPNPQ